jgi:hypothetical protein
MQKVHKRNTNSNVKGFNFINKEMQIISETALAHQAGR